MASKACLQALPPFPPPQSTTRLPSLADIFPISPHFFPFSFTADSHSAYHIQKNQQRTTHKLNTLNVKKKHKKEKRHDIHVSRDDSVLHCADCDQQI